MNKLDFLRKLDKALSVLDKEERREIIGFYEERFYNGTIYENKTEEEIIAELESPEIIARNVLEEYGVSPTYVKKPEERYTNISAGRVVLLLAFDAFIATWLIPTLVSVTFAVFGSVFSYFGTFSLLLGDRTTVDEFVFAFLSAGYVLLFLFGIFLLSVTIMVLKQIIVWHLNVFKIKGREKWIKKLSHFSVDAWFKRHRKARRVKNFLLVASLVTIVYTGLWGINHYDWVRAEYDAGEVINEVFTEDFADEIADGDVWNIDTDFGVMDVEVVLVSGNDVVIKHSYFQDDEFEYNFNYETNTLEISSKKDRFQTYWDVRDIFRVFNSNVGVRIEIPETLVLGDVDIKTITGDIDIRNMDLGQLDISNVTGDVVVTNMDFVDDVTIEVVTGDVVIRNLEGTNGAILTVDLTTGDIDVEDVQFEEYYFLAVTGYIELDNLSSPTEDGDIIEVSTVTGDISMANVYVDHVTLTAVTGDITYNNDDTSYMPTSYSKDVTTGEIVTNVR